MPAADETERTDLTLHTAFHDDAGATLSLAAVAEAILHVSSEALFVIDRQSRVLHVGEAGARLLGLPVSEIVGKAMDEIGFAPIAVSLIEPVFQTKQPISATALLYHGTCRYEHHASPILNNAGEVAAMLCVVRNIAVPQTEEEMSCERAQSLRATLQAAHLGLFEVDLTTDAVSLSEETKRLLGVPPEVQFSHWEQIYEYLHPDDRLLIVDAMAQSRQTGEPLLGEFRVQLPEGGIRWLTASGRAERTADGWQRVIGVVWDISERKEAERALCQSEERLWFALDAAAMIAWDWDIATGQVARQGNVAGVLGMQPSGESSHVAELFNLVHPDDRAAFEAACQSALEGNSDYQTEYRIVRPDGEVRWVADMGRVLQRARHFIGVLRDVTAHKATENTLWHSEERRRQQASLLETLLDHVPTGITIADAPDVTIRKVSLHGSQLSGVDRKDLEGKTQSEALWSVYQADGVTLADRAALPLRRATLQGEIIRNEEWVMQHRQTGEKITLLCNAAPVRDEAGNILCGIVAWSDITSLKSAQQEVANLNARLHRAVYESSHRIKNQLQVLAVTADLVLMDGLEVVPVDALRRLRAEIEAISVINDLLTTETRTDGTADHISSQVLLERILVSLQHTSNRYRLVFAIDEIRVPVKVATSMALIVNEAVSNAIKHGGTRIEVTLAVIQEQARLEVCDDGPGFPDGFDPQRAAHTGLDLLIALARIDLGGTVAFTNRAEGGARVIVVFPLPVAS